MLPQDGIHLPERTIGWPVGISAGARQFLMSQPTSAPASAQPPDPNDPDAWRTYVTTVNNVLLTHSPIFSVDSIPGISGRTTTLGGARVHIATPATQRTDRGGRVYLEMHTGGMVFLEGEGCRRGSLRVAHNLGAPVVSVDYRVPPDHPYPSALDDCVAAYRCLLDTHQPAEIIVGGTSGGANLAAATVLRARDEGLPLPAALVLLTPEIDLTESGDSFDVLGDLDPVLRGRQTRQIQAYAGDHDLTGPYLSPLFADFTRGFPPVFLQSGTRDTLLSNAVRMHQALRKARVPSELHIWEAMPHSGFGGTDEDGEVIAAVREFVDAHWAKSTASSAAP